MTAETKVLDHNYDGIQEFDNHLPNWWLWSFYLAIIFSAFYWWHYHTLETGKLPLAIYHADVKAANEEMQEWLEAHPVDDQLLLKMSENQADLDRGKELFLKPSLCVSCHLKDANGKIGPNLTDEYWIYDNDPMSIYSTILKGRPNGMPEHASKLSRLDVRRVAAYVLSLKNTNVPGKDPESNAQKM